MNYLSKSKIIEQYSDLCSEYKIQQWSISDRGLIDTDGTVYLNEKRLKILPLPFGKINGSFYCYNNMLSTLKGSPEYVEQSFDCDNNLLISLKHCPKLIDDNFQIQNNKLQSLKYSPEHIGGHYLCGVNELTSLEYVTPGGNYLLECSNNYIRKVEDVPVNFYIYGNPAYYLYNYITSTVEYMNLLVSIDYFNDYKILVNNVINIQRFKEFLYYNNLDSHIIEHELILAGYTIE